MERASKRKRDRLAERGLECRQATLHLLLYLLATTSPSLPRASQPRSLPTTTLRFPAPVITSTNIQAIAFRDRKRERERGGQPRGKFDGIGRLIPASKKRASRHDFHSFHGDGDLVSLSLSLSSCDVSLERRAPPSSSFVRSTCLE